MKVLKYDSVIIGGGAAGMAAAIEIKASGFNPLLIEREETLGGILLQCIHNGFGLHEFNEELTGPEYAEKFSDIIAEQGIDNYTDTTVMEIKTDNPVKEVFCYSKDHGVFKVETKSIVLAMGCRERNRGNIGTAGSRPSGIMTAGLAQRLVNIDGLIPGKEVVIVGSGDIGLIMARRMKLSGCNVKAVIEIMPYPSGLTRNIVQCLNDFDIPLYLGHVVTNIKGQKRIEEIEVTPYEEGRPKSEDKFTIACDTLLLSVGLVPENELSKDANIEINQMHFGPMVNSKMMTSQEGVFACGNVLHVHDLVDYVSAESKVTGKCVVNFLNKQVPANELTVKVGTNIRYIVPHKIDLESDNSLYMRSMIIKDSATLTASLNGEVIVSKKLKHLHPAEMITLNISKDELSKVNAKSGEMELVIS